MRNEVIILLARALLRQNKYLDMAAAKYQANVMIAEVEQEARRRN